MWCSNCQQDVPAVARLVDGPLVCSGCRKELSKYPSPETADTVSEVPLSSQEDAPRFNSLLEDEQSQQRMRRIDRQLRNSYRVEKPAHSLFEASATPMLQPEIQLKSIARHAQENTRSTKTSWPISMLLTGGILGLLAGVGMLVWSLAFHMARLWQWGITSTIVAEGILMLGLAWMALNLWKNSRRLNQQLTGVNHRLNEIQEQTGALAGSRMSSSQHYYQHFSQVASPHFLVADLRGQVDQLASRIASEN